MTDTLLEVRNLVKDFELRSAFLNVSWDGRGTFHTGMGSHFKFKSRDVVESIFSGSFYRSNAGSRR